MPFPHRDQQKLDVVTATIVQEMGSVGLFHYNKLTYLFEFLFIKNFGVRYTKEFFVRYPHGPVIVDYIKQILRQSKAGIFSTDESELRKVRPVDESKYKIILVTRTDATEESSIHESAIRALLNEIVQKYGGLSVGDLEKVVYSTSPMKKFLEAAKQGHKKSIGGYVLQRDCVRMADYDSPVTRGRKLALDHLRKYPNLITEQQAKIAEELSPLTNLRPSWTN